MSDFEKAVRRIALITPNLPLRAAIALAENGGSYPFPENPRENLDALTLWASQFPTVMAHVAEGKYIGTIREIRTLAPLDTFGRRLGLFEAKHVMEALQVM